MIQFDSFGCLLCMLSVVLVHYRQYLTLLRFRCSQMFHHCLLLRVAFYIPPKQSQAFLQGGTFVFQGDRTIFAHYDPSTAAHASVESVLELAMGRLTKETTPLN